MKNVPLWMDTTYNARTGVVTLLEDFDIDGTAKELVVVGMPLKDQ